MVWLVLEWVAGGRWRDFGCAIDGGRGDIVALGAFGEELRIPGAHPADVRIILRIALEKDALFEVGERERFAADAQSIHLGIGALCENTGISHALGAQRVLDRDAHAGEEPSDLFRVAMRDVEIWKVRQNLERVTLFAMLLIGHGLLEIAAGPG